MRNVALWVVRLADMALSPITFVSALWFKLIRRIGAHHMRLSREIFRRVGVFPIRDHYYEPLFQPRRLRRSLREVRKLPGLDLDPPRQLALLDQFRYADELRGFPVKRAAERVFYYDNGAFESGDAEYLYGVVRHFRPGRIIEIGSGDSTLMVRNAIRKNREEAPDYGCEHVCIEPFEVPWLESVGVRVVRTPVERVGDGLFRDLQRNDVLFIDSSHVIRPQGDVLFEYLEILPQLASGVLVQIHDIFTPRDVPDDWVRNRVRFWNEQYLLEAFLSGNRDFRVIGAVNYLKHEHFPALARACPILEQQPEREPGSFWMVRT